MVACGGWTVFGRSSGTYNWFPCMIDRARWLTALPLATAAGALLALHVVAPHYLVHQGFPVDDAWIHAVYARELARSGMLAYNPGVPATGETAIWADYRARSEQR